MAVISGRAQLLARDVTDAEVKKVALTIDEHARRCSGIISDMLAFARPEDPRPRRSVLKSLIDGNKIAKSFGNMVG